MFIGSWFKVIMTIPKKLGVFIKNIANLAGMIARKFLFFAFKFWKKNSSLLKKFTVVLQGQLK